MAKFMDCPECNGNGKVNVYRTPGSYEEKEIECRECNGSGEVEIPEPAPTNQNICTCGHHKLSHKEWPDMEITTFCKIDNCPCHFYDEKEWPNVVPTEGELAELQPEPEPIPLCDNILSAYDPERDGAGARVTRTDYALAEAITQLESLVHRQAHEIKLLQTQLAELTK